MLRAAANYLPGQAAQRLVRLSPALRRQPKLIARALSSKSSGSQSPLSAVFPADSYQLLPASEKNGAAEDNLYTREVEDVKQWWASPRYEGTRRPYSADDVVSKRGSIRQTYPSSLMARKLFQLLREKGAAGEPVHTSEESQEKQEKTFEDEG